MKRDIRCITINTDGSFCPITKAAGYAFYIKSDSFKLQQGGIIKAEAHNAEQVEIMTLCNAIYLLNKSTELTKTKVIVINIDCKGVIDNINTHSRKSLYKKYRQLIGILKQQTSCKDIRIKHVKAHVKIKDARSWVNHWCDKTAKSYMRQARKEKLNNTK